MGRNSYMKKIGVVVAILRELLAFLNDSSIKSELIKVGKREVYKSIINNNEVYFIKSGWGEIDASSATQILVSNFKCEYILNYGVVGALKKDMNVNDLFLVKKVVHYDFDTSSLDHSKVGQYGEFKDEYMPTSDNLIKLAKTLDSTLKEVICASGDKFISDISFKNKLAEAYDASICDMEAAGIVRTSFNNNIDCLLIKCISDSLEGDGSDFEKNVFNSSQKAFKLLKNIFYKL